MSNPPFTVRAVFEYASGHDEDLSFPIGQIITVTAVEDDEWYYGEYTDGAATKHEGIFPKNFVEKYDPPAPPRPTRPSRPKKDAESAPVEPPVATTESRSQTEPEVAESAPAEVEPPASKQIEAEPPQSPQGVSSPAAESYVSHQSLPQPARSAAAPAASTTAAAAPPPPVAKSSKPPPPAVAEKPSGSSFRDRIAAFNQSAAAPVAPFKPGGSQQSTSFIKKQFVAPPPSKDSFVAPPREPAPKVYRREEDPDVKEQLAREPPVSENRPPPPAPAPLPTSEEGSEDQPKPTSLKERIALLQKQQLEQSQRHAEAAQRKEKAKAVAKRPVEQQSEPVDAEPALATSPTDTAGTARDPSVETVRARAPPPQPAPFSPSEEVASESNDADYSASEDAGETSASKEEDEERLRKESTHAVEKQGEEADVEEDAVEPEAEEEDEEEELDPETRRRMELRARMAKMSGGMGMMGLFGPPGGLPGMGPPPASRKPKTPGDSEKRLAEPEPTSPLHAPPVPLPGMNTAPMASTNVEKEEELQEDEERPAAPITEQHASREVPDVEDVVHKPVTKRRSVDQPLPVQPSGSERSAAPAPPVPGSRPVPPPPVPSEAPGSPPSAPTGRPVMPPPRPSTGDESDDELSVHAGRLSINEPAKMTEVPAPALPDRLDARRPSTYDSSPPSTATSVADKRASRAPPPVPTNPPLPPAQNRAPPPPPPGPPRRPSTVDSHTSAPRQAGDDIEGEVTEYDGDYDTDIASGAKHKDALKARERDSSIDEGTITDDQSLYSARSPTDARLPPPLPPTAAPRGVPPPPPSQPPRTGRASIDTPRGPPPLPPSRDAPLGTSAMSEDEEYDPFNYAAPRHGLSNAPPPPSGRPEAPPVSTFQAATGGYGNAYDASPMTSPVHERPTSLLEKRPSLAPPPPPQSQAPSMPSPSIARSGRASMDLMRNQRRSMDISRPSIDQSFIATDVDLGEGSLWWSQPNTIPPIFQNRKDVLYEIEESSVPNNGGSTTISKDVYVLFMDYSQTVVTVQYDGKNPSDAHLEQRQEPPPHQPRQDQLEQAHFQIGTRISEAVNSIQNSTVGDGTPFGLIQHLLKPLSGALLPVGTRAYGALVYSNLANASVTQNDEIRAGDIVSFRNARFQGHRGTMHQKYSAEVGKPDHVGIVVDWDGTKKKIRAWEQGRESKKVKMESFKLNDLRSGECKVWRVMPRSWVSWESAK